MFTNLALFAANRVAGGAVGSVTRWAAWSAIAALFLTCSLVFGAMAVYISLEPLLGAVVAAAVVAGIAFALAVVCLLAPAVYDMMQRRAVETTRHSIGAVASTVEAINKETEVAVDYFGPLQVVSAAFLIGLRTGRQILGHPHS